MAYRSAYAAAPAAWRCWRRCDAPRRGRAAWPPRLTPNRLTSSLDHLVGKLLELRWHIKAECRGGLEVDHEIKLFRPLYRQLAWLGTMQDFGDVISTSSEYLGYVRPIRNRPPDFGNRSNKEIRGSRLAIAISLICFERSNTSGDNNRIPASTRLVRAESKACSKSSATCTSIISASSASVRTAVSVAANCATLRPGMPKIAMRESLDGADLFGGSGNGGTEALTRCSRFDRLHNTARRRV